MTYSGYRFLCFVHVVLVFLFGMISSPTKKLGASFGIFFGGSVGAWEVNSSAAQPFSAGRYFLGERSGT